MKCEVADCPRCIVGECELSNLDEKDYRYNDPSRCAHRKFRGRAAENQGSGSHSL